MIAKEHKFCLMQGRRPRKPVPSSKADASAS